MTKNRPNDEPSASDIILYQTEDGTTRLSVRLEGETVWLTQAAMAELFQTTPQNVTIHVKSIYEDGELEAEASCKDYLQVRSEGTRQVQRRLKHYNLDMVIAVGYRVRSHRGTQFRRWATERLSEYVVKGFTMDDERLKEGRTLGADYFDELLERIRDKRFSTHPAFAGSIVATGEVALLARLVRPGFPSPAKPACWCRPFVRCHGYVLTFVTRVWSATYEL